MVNSANKQMEENPNEIEHSELNQEPKRPWFLELDRRQKLILFVAWLGWVFDIFDTALFNFAKQPMLVEFLGKASKHAPDVEGMIQTYFLLGWSIGGLIFGILADKIGRTKVLIWTISIYCLLTGATALCRNPGEVAFIRFLTGIGIGGEWAAGAALVAESVSKRARAGAAAFLQTAAAVGPILAATVNLVLKDQSWRVLFLVGILPAIFAIYVRLAVKEPEKVIREEKGDVMGPLREIVRDPGLRKSAVIAILLGFVGIAGAGSITFWLPNLVQSVSVGLPAADVQARKTFATYTLHLGTFAGVLVFPMLCEKMGRRGAFALFFAFSPIALAVVALNKSYESLLICAPLLSFFAIGLTSGYGLYFPELFPTRVRATGAGIGYNTGRILNVPVPLLTGMIIGKASNVGQGLMVAGLLYLIGFLVLPFAPETVGQELKDSN